MGKEQHRRMFSKLGNWGQFYEGYIGKCRGDFQN